MHQPERGERVSYVSTSASRRARLCIAFAPDIGSAAKKNVTMSLKTAGGGLALFECDVRPPSPDKQHHPLINKKARVLKSDIEGKNSVIQVIDGCSYPKRPKQN